MLQDRFIYFPTGDPGAPPNPWEELTVQTTDGIDLTAWIRFGNPSSDRPLVIVLPGNAGNRVGRVPLGNKLANAGLDVVLSEYRGYGGNRGSPSEEGLIADALATVAAARRAVASSGPVVYHGESLGAAVAIAAAGEERPDALILASPFTSLVDVGRHHYPWLPVSTLLRDRYESLKRIENGALDGVPTLVIAGSGDRTIPFEQSMTIADAADAETFEVSGADHNDPAIRSASPVVAAIVEFLADREISAHVVGE